MGIAAVLSIFNSMAFSPGLGTGESAEFFGQSSRRKLTIKPSK
jgi:hypothetical protein